MKKTKKWVALGVGIGIFLIALVVLFIVLNPYMQKASYIKEQMLRAEMSKGYGLVSPYYKEILEKYPDYVPAQEELYELYMENVVAHDGHRLSADGAIEILEELDPYITDPGLQAQVDEQIAYYTDLNNQMEAIRYENIIMETSVDTPQGEAVGGTWENNDLPAMNNKYYVQCDGKIYFRKYEKSAFEEGALNAEYGYADSYYSRKELMCMDEDGQIVCVGSDYGYGPMCIEEVPGVGPRIFATRLNEEGHCELYSCDLSGGNSEVIYTDERQVEYYDAPWLTIVDVIEKKVIFTDENDLFYYVDILNQNNIETLDLNYNMSTPHHWFAWTEEAVYSWRWCEDRFEICAHYYTGEIEVLVRIDQKEMLKGCGGFEDDPQPIFYYPLSSASAYIIDEQIYLHLIRTEKETGNLVGGTTVIMDTENRTCTRIPDKKYAEFRVVKDGNNSWLYYGNEGNIVEQPISVLSLKGDSEAPVNVYPWIPKEETVWVEKGEDYELLIAPDDSGYSYTLLSEEEIDILSLKKSVESSETNGETIWNVVRAEYVGDKLFFSVEISEHNSELDVDGICYYTRQITYDCYKDLNTGVITTIHSY